MFGNFQIRYRIKEILNIINSDQLNNLDRVTINYYKNKILSEITRLYNIMPVVPQCTQDEINNKLITQLEGAIDRLNSINPQESTVKTLVRRLDSIQNKVNNIII